MATQLNADDMEMPSIYSAWRDDLQQCAIRSQVEKVVVAQPRVRIKQLNAIAVWDLEQVSDGRMSRRYKHGVASVVRNAKNDS